MGVGPAVQRGVSLPGWTRPAICKGAIWMQEIPPSHSITPYQQMLLSGCGNRAENAQGAYRYHDGQQLRILLMAAGGADRHTPGWLEDSDSWIARIDVFASRISRARMCGNGEINTAATPTVRQRSADCFPACYIFTGPAHQLPSALARYAEP